MIQLRKTEKTLIYGTYTLIAEQHPQVFAYIRSSEERHFLVYANLSSKNTSVDVPEEWRIKKTILTNYTDRTESGQILNLKPYEAGICKITPVK